METEKIKQADELEKKISKALIEFGKKYNDPSSKKWTEEIAEILYEISNGDYYVASKFKESADNREWLYDFVFYTNNENNTRLENIHLIAESEWRNRNIDNDAYFYEIRYDFEKLVVGRVKNKLMIFEGNDDKEIKNNITKLKEIVKNCKLPKIEEERYMFAVWNTSKQEFYIDLFVN